MTTTTSQAGLPTFIVSAMYVPIKVKQVMNRQRSEVKHLLLELHLMA